MSRLTIYDAASGRQEADLTDPADIGARLRDVGVRFERVPAGVALEDGAGQEEVLAAYAPLVAQNRDTFGYQTADVIRLKKGTPNTQPMREKFLSEHTHSEDEARMFVEGSGCFYLHIGGRVYQAVLERGDYISVPAGTRHWFDMGPDPHFAAIRFFTNQEGWVAQFTGDKIAERFPLYE
jgi:1,2-dihydroxy-3-keto-5-methylthiopentene dioxygenase